MAWYDKTGAAGDVVISSRVRFARNLDSYPFPARMSDSQRSEVIAEVTRALAPAGLTAVDPAAMSAADMELYVEKHYASPEFARAKAPRALLLDEDKQLAVMVCEEDHVRIQAFEPGLALDAAYKQACLVDDLLDESVNVAWSEKLGYLTQCPTNLGTAMRASVMLHLPALSIAGKIGSLQRQLAKLGVTVRGMYGEGSESAGALYQVSNSVTMGLTEQEIIEKLENVVSQLAESERKLRDTMKSDSYARLADRVMRAWGVMTNAYLLDVDEFMKLWSDVRLGAALGILERVELPRLTPLMIGAMPAALRASASLAADTPDGELSVLRAKYARSLA